MLLFEIDLMLNLPFLPQPFFSKRSEFLNAGQNA